MQGNMIRKIAQALLLSAGLCLCGCGSGKESAKTTAMIEWPQSNLAQYLPVLEGQGSVHVYGDSIAITKEQATLQDYQNYVDQCKAEGFTVESESSQDAYTAWNEEDYQLRVTYSSVLEQFDVHLDSPISMQSMSWPTMGLAAALPALEITSGKLVEDSSERLVMYVPMEASQRTAYEQQCYEAGFNQDYARSSSMFRAKTSDGLEVEISQESPHCVQLTVAAGQQMVDSASQESAKDTASQPAAGDASSSTEDAHEEGVVVIGEPAEEPASSQSSSQSSPTKEKPASTPEQSSSQSSSQNASSGSAGNSVTWREAVDSYEQFMMEYCDFMERYAEEGNPVGMLSDYLEMLEKAEEYDQKMEDLEDSDLSLDDLEYWTAAQLRINQRLYDLNVE